MRSNAFCDPTQSLNDALIFPPYKNKDFVIDYAIQSTAEILLRLMDSPNRIQSPQNTSNPRIPTPALPSSVHLDQVTDVSLAAPGSIKTFLQS